MSQEVKFQQIKSLISSNSETLAVVEGQIYEVPISKDDKTFLIVNLPPDFPQEPPVITLSPTGMRHPWVDGDVIMHDGLPSWTTKSNLGSLVNEIRQEFLKRPPAKKNTPIDTPQQQQQQQQQNKTIENGYNLRPPPPIPPTTTTTTNQEYMAISSLSPEQTEELLQNETAFEIFFNSLDRVKNLKTFQEDLRNGNEQLAYKNLSREDQLLKLRTEVENLQTQFQLNKLEMEQKEKLQNEAFNRFSAATVLTRLKASVYESDELSESVAQSFLEGNLDNDSFVKQFREFRKVYHLRASKLERAQKDNLFVSF